MKKLPKIIFNCEECGTEVKQPIYYYNRAKNHFCSRECHMKFMNKKLNPTRMTYKVKEKISAARSKHGVKEKGYIKKNGRHVHRIIAEEMLGRKLLSNEIVHHIDGNSQNNDPSNLQVMTQSEHCRLHFKKRGDEKC